MRRLRVGLLLALAGLAAVYAPRYSSTKADRLFDQYGMIRWEDERARLDNFAIQVQAEQNTVGYIFVQDGPQMCLGEAQARAIRAKRYIVEHRGTPWDRVIWRVDGYSREFVITLQPAPRDYPIPYPFLGYQKIVPEVHVTTNCRSQLAKIKQSKWE
jgi:hypothetical protein